MVGFSAFSERPRITPQSHSRRAITACGLCRSLFSLLACRPLRFLPFLAEFSMWKESLSAPPFCFPPHHDSKRSFPRPLFAHDDGGFSLSSTLPVSPTLSLRHFLCARASQEDVEPGE